MGNYKMTIEDRVDNKISDLLNELVKENNMKTGDIDVKDSHDLDIYITKISKIIERWLEFNGVGK